MALAVWCRFDYALRLEALAIDSGEHEHYQKAFTVSLYSEKIRLQDSAHTPRVEDY